MKLADGERHTHPVDVGLIDSRGVFLMLLDDDDTAYYRFSDETSLIRQLKHDAEFYKKRALELEGELFDAEAKRDEWRIRSDRYRRDFNEMKKRIMMSDHLCFDWAMSHHVKPRTLEDVLRDAGVSIAAISDVAAEIRELLRGDAE